MSDYFRGSIVIGGRLALGDLEEFCRACDEDGVGIDWAEGGLTRQELGDELAARAQAGEPLALTNLEAKFGSFETLEALCQRLGLTYCRHSQAKYAHDAELVWWSPGMAEEHSTYATDEGTPLIEIGRVRMGLTSSKPEIAVAVLRDLLAECEPVTVPPLSLIH